VEHLLETNVESPGLAVIRRLLSGHYNISKDAHGRLAFLFAVQEYRVPWMREQMEAFMAGMAQRYTASMLDAPGVAEETLEQLGMSESLPMLAEMREAFRRGDIKVLATPAASLHAMGYVLEPLLNMYLKMGWEVLETNSIPFVTSDCPVHRYYVPVGTEVPYSGLTDIRVPGSFPPIVAKDACSSA
jgi:hypothetical protein